MKDKIALVMGGGAGTGRATALAFSRKGARVVVADINEQSAREAGGDRRRGSLPVFGGGLFYYWPRSAG